VTDRIRTQPSPTASHRPRVVVIGAGFGGLRVVKGLRRAPVDVTVVDRNNFHVFQPLLYQVATAGLDTDDISFPLRGILRRVPTARFRMGTVTGVDLDGRAVALDDGRHLPYDYLVIAAGTISSDFGIPGVEEHTRPLKSLTDALAIRDGLLSQIEQASASGRPDAVEDLAIVVVGGGPTGVELAGAMRELLDRVLDKDFPELDLRRVPITLVEAADRILGPFHPSLSDRAARTLRDRGVEVVVGTGVDRIEHGTVVLADGRRLPAGSILWAAGVTASPVGGLLGIELARGGRIPVLADLSLAGHPEVFAIGDIAASPTDDGRALPQVAQPAIQGGAHVARQIVRLLGGAPTEPFAYVDKGSMATIGRSHAVVELAGGRRFAGRLGWVMWLGLHLVYLMGFRNRINVFVNWCWNYVTYDRAARILVEHEG
jgi:NADH dehydrogenase